MSIALVPFSPEHLEPAANLLAARHRADRSTAPELPERYEDPTAAATVLQDLMADDAMSGVAALRGSRPVGYLLGKPVLGSPTDVWAGAMQPRSAEVPHAGWAAAASESSTLYARMYAALAEGWVDNGLVAHYITVPAHAATAEPWLDLGFGRFFAMAVRETTPVAGPGSGSTPDLEVRRAGPDDLAAIQEQATQMFQAVNESPVFLPFLPETASARSQLMADLLADEACPQWLAFADGRLVGMQQFTEPTSTQWFISPLQAPEGTVYLHLASTAPEARSQGIGAALFAAGMDWARKAGYTQCLLHYHTANRAAVFWRGLGFRPVTHWLCRVIDQRRTWTGGLP